MTSVWPFNPLDPFSADLLVVDPPWRFALRSARGEAKSAQAHYETMSLDEIKALPVGQLARRDCWLFLWATAPMLPHALDVMATWSFRYVSRLAWHKILPSGKTRIGPGYVVRTMHEDVLVGVVGEPHYAKALPSLFRGLAREHSRKPDEFFDLIEAFAPRAYCVELFARKSRPNWRSWGRQSTMFDGEAA